MRVLVSKYVNCKVFLNYVCTLFNYAPTKTDLYLINSDEHGYGDIAEMQTKGTATKRLIDYGITKKSQIVILQTFSCYTQERIYKEIAKALNFNLSPEILQELHQVHEDLQADFNKDFTDIHQLSFTNSEKNERKRSSFNLDLQQYSRPRDPNVPPEYADDPDLYYALQASIQDCNADLGPMTGWNDQRYNNNAYDDLENVLN